MNYLPNLRLILSTDSLNSLKKFSIFNINIPPNRYHLIDQIKDTATNIKAKANGPIYWIINTINAPANITANAVATKLLLKNKPNFFIRNSLIIFIMSTENRLWPINSFDLKQAIPTMRMLSG